LVPHAAGHPEQGFRTYETRNHTHSIISDGSIPPNVTGPYDYTSPMVHLPSGEYIMDSRPIANALDSLHPTPSLHLDSPYLAKIEELLPKLVNTVRPVFVPLVPKKFLLPRSAEYFTASREKGLNMSLDEFAKGADKAFEDVKPHVKTVSALYQENADGPFLLGQDVSYADFYVLGFLRMMDRLGVADKFWNMDGGIELKKAYEAAAKWFEHEN
jgi:glutathione S-transferase